MVVQSTANATSSDDVIPFVIPEPLHNALIERHFADANATATDSVRSGSVSSWSVVSDRA